MKLVLLRHGVTEWNLEKRIQGRIDQPLSDIGREQLAQFNLPPLLDGYQWYSSPLCRATETAELLGLTDIEIETALIEMHWGDWEGKILKPLRKRLGDEMRDNESRGLDFCPPGGESPRQVQARLQGWLTRIASLEQDVAAVVHKGIIRCIYALAFDWDMRGESPVDFSWDSLHRFELAENGTLLNNYQAIPLGKNY